MMRKRMKITICDLQFTICSLKHDGESANREFSVEYCILQTKVTVASVNCKPESALREHFLN